MIVVVGKENPAYLAAAGGLPVRFVSSLDGVDLAEVLAVVGHLPGELLAKAPRLRWVGGYRARGR